MDGAAGLWLQSGWYMWWQWCMVSLFRKPALPCLSVPAQACHMEANEKGFFAGLQGASVFIAFEPQLTLKPLPQT